MKYRKKSVIVEAIKWDGLNVSEIEAFCRSSVMIVIHDAAWKAGAAGVKADVSIGTLEGIHHASVGDYIIKGVHGEFYPCKPDIFAETYEAVDEDESVKCSLFHDEGFSYQGIGLCDKGFNMTFDHDSHRDVSAISVTQWDEKRKENITVGRYFCKYCPECGRRLHNALPEVRQ